MNRSEHWHICDHWEECTEIHGTEHCVCQVPHEYTDGCSIGCEDHPDAACRPFEMIWVD